MRDTIPIEPNQSFTVDSFKPDYAPGITNLFKLVYGDKYPLEIYYHPHKIIRSNKNKSIYSVVAKTQKGEVIGHGGVYKAFPDNKKLYELGQLLVHNYYRDTTTAQGISEFIKKQLVDILPIDGVFGEATTNQTGSQRLSANMGLLETGLEISLIPESIFKDKAQSNERISCLFQFLLKRDFRHTIFFHQRAKELIEFVVKKMNLKRDIVCFTGAVDSEDKSKIKGVFLEKINAMRFNIIHTGFDIENCIDKIMDEAYQRDISVYQFIINISEQRAIKSFNILFHKGFFIGGLLPIWFKSGDGFLMQKINDNVSFDNIKIYSKESWHLLNLIIRDYEKNS
ncbi:MAG: hypothetical protein N2738_00785 [Thermodesulfovibrionales bacterium]|nr:hypothetical protein [Thermodesulfovibrionales bacterium]